MAKVYPSITPELRQFAEAQPVFFVASAPLAADGHINLSPKGCDTFRVLDEHRVAYLDLTGSGNETSAHLAENGRITLMFCAFQGAPKILRFYGRGRTVLPDAPEFSDLVGRFGSYPGVRQVIVAEIDRVQTSCGFAVPFMDLVGERPALTRWAEARGEAALEDYRREKNSVSIDGLPAPLGFD